MKMCRYSHKQNFYTISSIYFMDGQIPLSQIQMIQPTEMLVNPDKLSNYYSHIALNMRLIDGFIYKSNNT